MKAVYFSDYIKWY